MTQDQKPWADHDAPDGHEESDLPENAREIIIGVAAFVVVALALAAYFSTHLPVVTVVK